MLSFGYPARSLGKIVAGASGPSTDPSITAINAEGGSATYTSPPTFAGGDKVFARAPFGVSGIVVGK